MKILIMGASGSGKSTVGKTLAEALKWGWVDTGEIFRQSKEPWVVEQLKTAKLFDDDLTADLVLPRIKNFEHVIWTGFPRTLHQAEILKERDILPDVVVEVDVPVAEIEKRLALRGRAQDTPEVIAERVAMYEETKAEILAFLIGNGVKLVTIDGVGEPRVVYKRALAGLKDAIAELER